MVKTLQEHEKVSNGEIYCDLCGFRIPKGKPYIEQVNIDDDDPNGEEYTFNMHKCCNEMTGQFIYADDLTKDSFWEEIDNEVFNSDRIRKKLLKAVMDEFDINNEEIEVDDDD